MSIFNLFMILFIPIGTYLLNYFRKRMCTYSKAQRFSYFILSITMGAAPMVYLQSVESERGLGTVLAIFLVGIAFFWFPIVGGREPNT
ncbi:hypothetical protein [Shewanella colwelliana]|nr:hypothetical protein [Shewanella colwelliana]